MKFPLFLLTSVLVLSGCSDIGEPKEISIYFTTTKNNVNMEDCAKVAKATRLVKSESDMGPVYFEQLLEGPTSEEKAVGSVPHILTQNSLGWKNFWQKNSIVYINWPDFRQEIPNATTSCGSQAFLAPIEKTMQELPGIKHVVHAINGDPQVFYEWMQMSCPEYSNDCDKAPFVDTAPQP